MYCVKYVSHLSLFVLALNCFVLAQASGQFVQQGTKLVGTGAVGGGQQGMSVALSADGNTAIVGGQGDNNRTGAAWVYIKSGGVWSQQGTKLVGTGAVGESFQGSSVALSADGNTAIVGGHHDNNGVGAAWIFTRSGGVWSQQGTKLVGADAVGDADQGASVSLSADGNTAIVGGGRDNSSKGAAWVYTRSGSVWSQQGSKLVGTGAVGDANQGYCVRLSADGNTALVGGHGDNGTVGAVWVFTRTGGVWSQQGSKLVGAGVVGGALFGIAASLSADGNSALIGGPWDDNIVGAVWTFTRSGGVWSQQGNKLVAAGAVGAPDFGTSVSLSADGNTAIVGADQDNNRLGAAWVYTRSGGAWTQLGSKLVGTGSVGVSFQGASVSLSADGNTAIVGGPFDNSYAGAAWIYSQSGLAVGEQSSGMPRRFSLEQNYPNPFNPSTKIQFSIPNRELAVVKVYDVLGRDVATLVNERKDPGTYTVEFNGSGLPSGVYLMRLQAGDFAQSRRLTLVK